MGIMGQQRSTLYRDSHPFAALHAAPALCIVLAVCCEPAARRSVEVALAIAFAIVIYVPPSHFGSQFFAQLSKDKA